MQTSIGLSKPFVALYNPNGGTPSYSSGVSLGMSTSFDMNVNGAEPAVLNADNGPAEAVTYFNGGTATYGVHRLTLANLATILGQTVGQTGGVDFLADANAPYVGAAVISQDIAGGVISYTVILLWKIKFQTPNITRVTRADGSVEYQVPSLNATIMRDDSASSKWMHMENFATEALALAYIKTALSIPDAQITAAQALTWGVAAGSSTPA